MQVTLERRSLVSQVADHLRHAIISGQFQTGEKLPEAALAQQYSVGRSTLREALRMLSAEGLLEKEPQKTWRVRQISERTIWEVAVVRSTLESLAAYLAVQRLSSEAAGKLTAAIEEMESASMRDDLEGFNTADMKFHRILLEASDNQILLECWSTLAKYCQLLLAGGKAKDSPEVTVSTHKAVLRALLGGDPQGAALTIRNQIYESYRRPIYDECPEPWPADPGAGAH